MSRWTYGAGIWLALAVLIVGCAAPAPSQSLAPAPQSSGAPGAPKRIVAAIRGDPFTLADAINSAGGGRVAGVRGPGVGGRKGIVTVL